MHCDNYQARHLLVLLYDYNIRKFEFVVRLDIYILEDFDFLRLYHWFSRMSVPLFLTRQAILLTQTQ